jgi:hypothetical protein
LSSSFSYGEYDRERLIKTNGKRRGKPRDFEFAMPFLVYWIEISLSGYVDMAESVDFDHL